MGNMVGLLSCVPWVVQLSGFCGKYQGGVLDSIVGVHYF